MYLSLMLSGSTRDENIPMEHDYTLHTVAEKVALPLALFRVLFNIRSRTHGLKASRHLYGNQLNPPFTISRLAASEWSLLITLFLFFRPESFLFSLLSSFTSPSSDTNAPTSHQLFISVPLVACSYIFHR